VSKYLILFKNGSTREAFGKVEEEKAWMKVAERYPAVCAFLKQFEAKGKARSDQGEYWWELRACAYYEEFEKEKIIVPAIIKGPSNLIDGLKSYSNDKTTIIGTSSTYVLGIMNCKVTDFFMQQISSTKQNGYFEYKPVYISQIQIPVVSTESQEKVGALVDEISSLKSTDPTADTSALEAEIDWLVYGLYGLYGLTEEEVGLVEGELPRRGPTFVA
jgi:adenine-specific DNA-methyltransferase